MENVIRGTALSADGADDTAVALENCIVAQTPSSIGRTVEEKRSNIVSLVRHGKFP